MMGRCIVIEGTLASCFLPRLLVEAHLFLDVRVGDSIIPQHWCSIDDINMVAWVWHYYRNILLLLETCEKG